MALSLGTNCIPIALARRLRVVQYPLAITLFKVVLSPVRVFLALGQHGVDQSGQFVRRCRQTKRPARLAQRLVFPLITLPPVIWMPEHKTSPGAKCLQLGNLLISLPTSQTTTRAVVTSMRVKSTPHTWADGVSVSGRHCNGARANKRLFTTRAAHLPALLGERIHSTR
jgi:hypothetical protein